MKRKFTLLGFVLLFLPAFVTGQVSDPAPNKAGAVSRRMFVDPSSTWVSFAKVSLTVSPLTLKGNSYLADYQIKVVPYFLRNEKGTMALDASDPMVRKLLKGTASAFTGKATNTKNGRIKVVIGKTTPSANDRGIATFSIVTENGLMVFTTFYHLKE